jgi:hypothetical protein
VIVSWKCRACGNEGATEVVLPNPAEVLRTVAEDQAAGTGVEVDHASFDKAAAELSKPFAPRFGPPTPEDVSAAADLFDKIAAGIDCRGHLLWTQTESRIAREFARRLRGDKP